MTNLLIAVLEHLSINSKGYTFFENALFKKWGSLWNFFPIGTNFKILVNYSVYHTKFVYRWQKTIKMGVHTTKVRFPINRCHEWQTSTSRNDNLQFFFSCSNKKDVLRRQALRCAWSFERNWPDSKPFQFIKWWENIWLSRS